MKRWVFPAILLAGLACLVPLSSKRPDAVQHVLGLRGGVDTFLKAAGGIFVTAAAVIILMVGLKKLGGKR